MKNNHSSEKGQAIVMLVLGIMMLLGFTALAVDGGMVYSDRRNAQNGSDAAALAGALQKANGRSNSVAGTIVHDSLTANGFNPGNASVTFSTMTDFSGTYDLVTVVMTNTTQTNFAQVIFGRQLVNKVTAVARARRSAPAMPGTAIVAMGNCVDGTSPDLISALGGGNDGGVLTYQGGMFVNAPEPAGTDCAIVPPNSAQSPGIVAHDGYPILSVGYHNYSEESGHMDPIPIQTGVNGGARIDDPLSGLPEPTCSSNGSISQSNGTTIYHPGRYGGAGQPNFGTPGVLNPGIYCITDNFDEAGGGSWTATSGVVLYFINGGMNFTGNANLYINAPNASNCQGTEGATTASCTYKGIAIFAARNNSSLFSVRGNGDYKINGMVYTLSSEFQAKGGGTSSDEYVVNGQIIAKRVSGCGGGTFTVTYNAGNTYWLPTRISLQK